MPNLPDDIPNYIEQLRSSDFVNGYHNLLEAGGGAIPFLMEAYLAEDDAQIREILVEIISRHEAPSTLPFLAEALQDSASQVWKQALDGLVTIGSEDAKEVIRTAMIRRSPHQRSEFIEFAEEALEQMSGTSN